MTASNIARGSFASTATVEKQRSAELGVVVSPGLNTVKPVPTTVSSGREDSFDACGDPIGFTSVKIGVCTVVKCEA